MNNTANFSFISAIGLIFLISNLLLIKIKWENAVMSGQLDRLNLENTKLQEINLKLNTCLLYTSPSPRDAYVSRMPSSA